ncbi:CoA transferase [Streptomyces sp. NPDC050355]|uniref:CoA transferase n=1 Tax=Streptomyces sp. NPDC050355 TaxID=3365609 RepID=UPI0037959133
MAHTMTTGTALPLDGIELSVSGPPALASTAVGHLQALGARPAPTDRGGPAGHARLVLAGQGEAPVPARVRWADLCPPQEVCDEATAQAACGVMTVHGQRDGGPRGLAVDYAATAAGVLTVQGLLAALIGRARGGAVASVSTAADRAALLTVSQYVAAAGADEGEAAPTGPGGPPFTTAEGTRFELEALEPAVWAGFWRVLGAPQEAIRAGWRPFQFRYATACAPLPDVLHTVTRARGWEEIRRAATTSGADVCRLHTLAERAAEGGATGAPWTLAPRGEAPRAVPDQLPSAARPLEGMVVLEAGRRIQAPLAAHLLGLLGAEVVRIEPPGGDPLRGMPPTCSGLSARWLALNRGKKAVEIDIKSPSDRHRLREMAAGADVFLHNWAPGKAEQLGLDSDALSAANPGLVYAYTSGFAGRELPGAPMGTDFMVQARTGVGEAARPAGEPPAPSLMTLLDVLGGLLGAEAVLAGLLTRERTGRGMRVDSSLLGAAEVLTAPALRRAAAGRDPRRPAGFRHPLRTADGWLAPADACAAEAAGHRERIRRLPTSEAVADLRARGLVATAVSTDLTALANDPRLAGALTRDAHGAPAVPSPWSLS